MHVVDDTVTPTAYSAINRESLSATFGVGVPAAMDILIDLVMLLQSFGASESSKSDGNTDLDLTRLNTIERTLFIIGVLFQGATSLTPITTNYSLLNAVYICTNNLSTMLNIAPVTLFMGRIAAAWTPRTVTLMICLVSTVSIVASFQCLVVDDTSALYGQMNIVELVCIVLATALFVVKSINMWMVCISTVRRAADDDLMSGTRTPGEYAQVVWTKLASLMDANFAITFHCIALSVLFSLNLWWYTAIFTGAFTNRDTGTMNYVYMLSQALVLVVEMRVRHREVKSGLHVIESRRTFVRFVSHEVRTTV